MCRIFFKYLLFDWLDFMCLLCIGFCVIKNIIIYIDIIINSIFHIFFFFFF